MEIAVGAVLEGKVTGITKFGAFVSLPGGKTGMVHISEIAHTYVNDINEYLSIGQTVKVKVIAIDHSGKINLSIKKTTEAPQRSSRQDSGGSRSGQEHSSRNSQQTRRNSNSSSEHRQTGKSAPASKEPQTFDDMLKQFMADSDSKISSIKQYSDHRTKSKRRQ